MTHRNLTEFHIDHDNQHELEAVTTQNPSCPRCHPLERQSVEFKQFLSWYKNRQSVKTFSQRTVEIFDRYLTDLNQHQGEDGTLTKDQIKVLGERARFIVKSFRYSGRSSTRSAELGYYITKLAEAIGFSPRRLHETTYQEQILEWEQEYAESQNKGRSYILNPFKHLSWDLRSRKDKGKEEAYSSPGDDFEEQVLFGYKGSTKGSSST